MNLRRSKGMYLRACTICKSFSHGENHMGKPICRDCIELIKRMSEIV